MLTINSDNHPVLSRLHRPEDEKRSLIHIRPNEYDAWLDAGPELARVMLELPPADILDVAAAPAPPRKSTPKSKASPEPLL